jgi:hypothetical protein
VKKKNRNNITVVVIIILILLIVILRIIEKRNNNELATYETRTINYTVSGFLNDTVGVELTIENSKQFPISCMAKFYQNSTESYILKETQIYDLPPQGQSKYIFKYKVSNSENQFVCTEYACLSIDYQIQVNCTRSNLKSGLGNILFPQ